MYWTLIALPEHPIPDQLAGLLEERFGPQLLCLTVDFVNGGQFAYYLKGLHDAGVEGALTLLAAIEKYASGGAGLSEGGIRIYS